MDGKALQICNGKHQHIIDGRERHQQNIDGWHHYVMMEKRKQWHQDYDGIDVRGKE